MFYLSKPKHWRLLLLSIAVCKKTCQEPGFTKRNQIDCFNARFWQQDVVFGNVFS